MKGHVMGDYESRTAVLNHTILSGLSSLDLTQQTAAIDQLPEVLSQQEVCDVGLQIRQASSTDPGSEVKLLEEELFLHIECGR